MKRTNLLLIIIGLMLIGVIGAYKMYNKKHVDVIQAKAYQTLTAMT